MWLCMSLKVSDLNVLFTVQKHIDTLNIRLMCFRIVLIDLIFKRLLCLVSNVFNILLILNNFNVFPMFNFNI